MRNSGVFLVFLAFLAMFMSLFMCVEAHVVPMLNQVRFRAIPPKKLKLDYQMLWNNQHKVGKTLYPSLLVTRSAEEFHHSDWLTCLSSLSYRCASTVTSTTKVSVLGRRDSWSRTVGPVVGTQTGAAR